MPRTPLSGSLSCPLSVQAASLVSCQGRPLPSCCLGSGQIHDPASAYFPLVSSSLRLFFPLSRVSGSSFSLPCGLLCVIVSLSPPTRLLLDPNPSTVLPSHLARSCLSLPPSLPTPWGLSAPRVPFCHPQPAFSSVPLKLSAGTPHGTEHAGERVTG